MTAPTTITAAPCFTTLACFGFLALEGARAIDFLQGQLTCDLRQASAGHAVSGAWCTPKGRVICSLVAWPQAADRVILRLHGDLAESTAAQLSKYAALSRVRIAPVALRCVGLLRADEAAFDQLELPRPAGAGDVIAIGEGAVLRADAAGLRHELWLPEDVAETWLQRLRAVLAEGTGNDWTLALVRAGIAEIRAATRELFLPQMLGYDTDARVSFRKGCYTGQEIVARAHYKGGVKRHLQRLLGRGQPPAPGSALERAGVSAGTIVESAASAEGCCEVLAVIADDHATPASDTPLLAGGLELHLPA
jgi:hypothetical protein